ncbi:hypothetical protein, partial [Methanosarcina sp. UBA411]|uniref:hypothetical protein n=1 Tax=Methanosarcina sp. UBA411 TaxID=1915589 RepID=UPI0025CE18B6
KYSSIAFAAFLPAPIALITVAVPVTTSPPAKTPHLKVAPAHGGKSLPHVSYSKTLLFSILSINYTSESSAGKSLINFYAFYHL